jgi:hypothetical protein
MVKINSHAGSKNNNPFFCMKYIFKKLLPKYLLALSFLLSFHYSKATHVIGGECQWKCIGNDTYEIKILFYRRCTDGTIPLAAVKPVIMSDSCSNSYNINPGNYTSWSIQDITPVCYRITGPCPVANGSGPSTPQLPIGMEKHVLTYKVFLGGVYSNCCWYKISFEVIARNSNITTGYADQTFYSEAWLNRCVTPSDKGPEFKNPPLILKCVGQDVQFNNGGVDEDGDSLSYETAVPLIGSGSSSLYTSPWSPSYPLTCLGGNNSNPNSNPPTGYNLDPVSGEILFRPMVAQVTVIKTMVTEWRKINGVYKVIGKTGRDVQVMITQNCNNSLPTLNGSSSDEFCPGIQSCINISSDDADAGDTTRIFWNQAIPNAVFTSNNGTVKNATSQICWTPGDSDARTVPYYFTAKVQDSKCPAAGENIRVYKIIVHKLPPKPFIIQNSNVLYTSAASYYQWYLNNTLITNAAGISYMPLVSGSYTVKITDTFGCSNISDPYNFALGIGTNKLESAVLISPNPFHDHLDISIGIYKNPLTVTLYSMEGKKLSEYRMASRSRITLHTSSFANGVYILEVSDGESKFSKRVEKN